MQKGNEVTIDGKK